MERLTLEHVDGPVDGPMGLLMQLARAGMLERQTTHLAGLLGRAPTTLHAAVSAALA
jgi:NAD(P)H dehydrogenase (quinone)